MGRAETKATGLNIAIIGHGAMADAVLHQLGTGSGNEGGSGAATVRFGVCRPGRQDAAGAVFGADVALATTIAELPDDLDLVVDCAGHPGLMAHGQAALLRGFDVLTLSIGALADRRLADGLADAAVAGRSRLHLASGAIGSLDALAAAAVGGLDLVRYVGRKPPRAWRGSMAEEVMDLDNPPDEALCHFRGDAGQAARLYPSNANVAAAVALAGIGFADTEVELWADPGIERTIHRVEAEGTFGQLAFELIGRALPANPKSSALAAMSVVAHIRRLRAPVGF